MMGISTEKDEILTFVPRNSPLKKKLEPFAPSFLNAVNSMNLTTWEVRITIEAKLAACGRSLVVEHCLPKARVAGSSPVVRFMKYGKYGYIKGKLTDIENKNYAFLMPNVYPLRWSFWKLSTSIGYMPL